MMNHLLALKVRFDLLRRDTRGASAIEYALIAAAIAVVAAGALSPVGENLSTKFGAIATGLE